MTKSAAVYQWLSSFGLQVYAVDSVPNVTSYPYMTYDLSVATFGDGDCPLIVNLYYRETAGAVVNAKAEEIAHDIGRGGKLLLCDDGAIWITRGNPFWQAIKNTDDDKIRQRYININVEWLTQD